MMLILLLGAFVFFHLSRYAAFYFIQVFMFTPGKHSAKLEAHWKCAWKLQREFRLATHDISEWNKNMK